MSRFLSKTGAVVKIPSIRLLFVLGGASLLKLHLGGCERLVNILFGHVIPKQVTDEVVKEIQYRRLQHIRDSRED